VSRNVDKHLAVNAKNISEGLKFPLLFDYLNLNEIHISLHLEYCRNGFLLITVISYLCKGFHTVLLHTTLKYSESN